MNFEDTIKRFNGGGKNVKVTFLKIKNAEGYF